MASFVLIHGSWQGAWCWREIVPRLRAQGHQALAIDLPGHGQEGAPLESVTFRDYVDSTVRAAEGSADEAILVGHSMGGAIVNQAAEQVPGRVRALVSVAGLIPANGRSMMSYVEEFDPEYLAQLVWAPDRRSARITADGVRRFLCSRCPAETVEAILPLLGPEPVAPYETKLSFNPAACENVPRYSVECLQDRVVPAALQRAMRGAIPRERVFSLDTDHSPFFSMPADLTAILHQVAEQG